MKQLTKKSSAIGTKLSIRMIKCWILGLESWPVKISNDPIKNKRQIHTIVGELWRSFFHGNLFGQEQKQPTLDRFHSKLSLI